VTTYDEDVLQQYADTLYRQAKRIVLWTALKYGFVVFLVALVLGIAVDSQGQVPSNKESSLYGSVLILTVLGGIAGVAAGRRKAFYLKLQAQQTLCQRQIEMNTRKDTGRVPTTPDGCA
jgi:hypothetical protein